MRHGGQELCRLSGPSQGGEDKVAQHSVSMAVCWHYGQWAELWGSCKESALGPYSPHLCNGLGSRLSAFLRLWGLWASAWQFFLSAPFFCAPRLLSEAVLTLAGFKGVGGRSLSPTASSRMNSVIRAPETSSRSTQASGSLSIQGKKGWGMPASAISMKSEQLPCRVWEVVVLPGGHPKGDARSRALATSGRSDHPQMSSGLAPIPSGWTEVLTSPIRYSLVWWKLSAGHSSDSTAQHHHPQVPAEDTH